MNRSESKYFNTAAKFDQALLALLEKKPFEYITVSELCAAAGVNRSTFYLHYENTFDLLQETTKYVLDGFLSYFPFDQSEPLPGLSERGLDELNFIKEEYLHPYLSYIRENQQIFAAVLSCPKTYDFESIFQKLLEHIFNPILDRFCYPADTRRYVMMFYLNGVTAIVSEWLRNGCNKSISEVSAIIHDCIFGRQDQQWPSTAL